MKRNPCSRRLALAIGLIVTAANLVAVPLERDLGNGVVYFRAHTLPADLPPSNAIRTQPCVLDLRYARGGTEASTALSGWVKFHASPRTPVIVLVNRNTSSSLLSAFARRDAIAGLLLVGVAEQSFRPDITVDESDHDERQAYEAMEKGATVATLTTDHPDKQRNDEASLARDRSADSDSDDEDAAIESEPVPTAKPHSPPIDAALQRAIHVLNALRAMKKL